MGITEAAGQLCTIEHALDLSHLGSAMALQSRAAAYWNQNEADWRYMLANGQAWGISQEDGTLVASTVVLPYGEATCEGFAWISMVLVPPEHRRRGLASRLLRLALAELAHRGLTPILDATPAGRAVYVREGFHDTWGFKRYRRAPRQSSQSPPVPVPAIRPIARADWPSIMALDSPAFGANREHPLRDLAERLPEAALVAGAEGRIEGYLLGRDGREACQLGPLVARDLGIARRLLDAALPHLPGALYIDVADRFSALRSWLDAAGFTVQRPFTRMVHGGKVAPGDAATVVAVAGPEFG
ncbi:MAG: GNAT family N-acetyltransferase [Casimicrobiaceae bacterium]